MYSRVLYIYTVTGQVRHQATPSEPRMHDALQTQEPAYVSEITLHDELFGPIFTSHDSLVKQVISAGAP